MQLSELGLNRNLFKTNTETGVTDSSMMSANNLNDPANSGNSGSSLPGTSSQGNDAGQIQTGTVIVACIIKTSDLPTRVELNGNDMFLYDNSAGGGGTVTGDTASINFLRTYDVTKGFVIQARAGKDNNLDNVWEFFALPPTSTRFNAMFIGRKGDATTGNLGTLTISVDTETSKIKDALNGSITMTVSRNGVKPNLAALSIVDARFAFNDDSKSGQVIGMIGSGPNGLAGIGFEYNTGSAWVANFMLYADGPTSLKLGNTLLPDAGNTYDIGAAGNRIKKIWATDLSGFLDGGNLYNNTVDSSKTIGVTNSITLSWTPDGGTTFYNFTLNFTNGLLTSIT